MKGLEKLPEASKDLIFPLIAARPWPNANQLESTWQKISTAFGDRRFALDLDRFKFGAPSERLAARQFDELFNPAGGYSAYYDAVSEIPNAIPVIRFSDGLPTGLDLQIEQILALDRGAVLRVEHDFCPNPIGLIREVKAAYPETTLFIDLGWTRDILSREMWASRILADLGDDDPEAEIVIVGSSFPDQFRPIARDEILVEERAVFEALVRRHNAVVLTYGDWGSTRAPRKASPMRTVRRLDLPLSREWLCFRDGGDEDYSDLALRVLRDSRWPGDLNIWGTYLISGTAENIPGSIRGQAAAAAARINIHMYRQVYFGEVGAIGDGDEPFVD